MIHLNQFIWNNSFEPVHLNQFIWTNSFEPVHKSHCLGFKKEFYYFSAFSVNCNSKICTCFILWHCHGWWDGFWVTKAKGIWTIVRGLLKASVSVLALLNASPYPCISTILRCTCRYVRFSYRCNWGFRLSEVMCYIAGWVAVDSVKEGNCRPQSLADEGDTFVRNVRNQLPNSIVSHHRRPDQV